MAKALIFVAFVPVSMLVAGLFGAFHDQISYTVSHEYFTRFKFIEFNLVNLPLPDRIRAAIVGFLASWWMGLPIGILCGAAGLIQRKPGLMVRALAISLAIAIGVDLAAALIGLGYGWFQTASIDPAAYAGWYLPDHLRGLRAFLCAGYMHNGAYLGGAAVIPAVWLFQAWYRARSA